MAPPDVESILQNVCRPGASMGELRKAAKSIGTDHPLAMALWAYSSAPARHLAILLMDRNALTDPHVESLIADLETHPPSEQTRLMEWLMANQLAKSASGKRMMLGWEHHRSALQRRTWWYWQARLRWKGNNPLDNSEALLTALESRMADEDPRVQWAMNLTAGWIGIHEPAHRARCVALGTALGLYRDEKVSRGCTPNYLPEFIRIEVAKRGS